MEIIDPLRMVFGFVFTIALVLAAWVAVRRFAPGMVQVKHGNDKRLRITEALPLDAKRRLLIIQDGDQEHLVLLGATNETVLQSRKARLTNLAKSESS